MTDIFDKIFNNPNYKNITSVTIKYIDLGSTENKSNNLDISTQSTVYPGSKKSTLSNTLVVDENYILDNVKVNYSTTDNTGNSKSIRDFFKNENLGIPLAFFVISIFLKFTVFPNPDDYTVESLSSVNDPVPVYKFNYIDKISSFEGSGDSTIVPNGKITLYETLKTSKSEFNSGEGGVFYLYDAFDKDEISELFTHYSSLFEYMYNKYDNEVIIKDQYLFSCGNENGVGQVLFSDFEFGSFNGKNYDYTICPFSLVNLIYAFLFHILTILIFLLIILNIL